MVYRSQCLFIIFNPRSEKREWVNTHTRRSDLILIVISVLIIYIHCSIADKRGDNERIIP